MNVRHVRISHWLVGLRRPLAATLVAVIALTGLASAGAPAVADAAATTTALYTDGPGPLTEGHATYLAGATTEWSVTRTADGNELDVHVDDAACDPWPNCPGDPYAHHWFDPGGRTRR